MESMTFLSDGKGLVTIWIGAEKAACLKPMISYPFVAEVACFGHLANGTVRMNTMSVNHVSAITGVVSFVEI